MKFRKSFDVSFREFTRVWEDLQFKKKRDAEKLATQKLQ
jgi:hypothetical protein